MAPSAPVTPATSAVPTTITTTECSAATNAAGETTSVCSAKTIVSSASAGENTTPVTTAIPTTVVTTESSVGTNSAGETTTGYTTKSIPTTYITTLIPGSNGAKNYETVATATNPISIKTTSQLATTASASSMAPVVTSPSLTGPLQSASGSAVATYSVPSISSTYQGAANIKVLGNFMWLLLALPVVF